MPRRIFLSYRREDSAATAGRVYDRLSRAIGKSNIFFDVSTIGAGENFHQKVEHAINKSEVAIIFIGDKWLGGVPTTGARIWKPDDHVRA